MEKKPRLMGSADDLPQVFRAVAVARRPSQFGGQFWPHALHMQLTGCDRERKALVPESGGILFKSLGRHYLCGLR